MPIRKPRSFSEDAAEFFASASSVLKSPFGVGFGGSGAGASTSAAGAFDLQEGEVLEQDRRDDEQDDSSPAAHREVRMITLPAGGQKGVGTGAPNQSASHGAARSRERRRWEIVPILKEKVRMTV